MLKPWTDSSARLLGRWIGNGIDVHVVETIYIRESHYYYPRSDDVQNNWTPPCMYLPSLTHTNSQRPSSYKR